MDFIDWLLSAWREGIFKTRASGVAVDVLSELNGPAECGVNPVVSELDVCWAADIE